MASYRSVAVVLAGALASLGASYPTQNFVVEAPTYQIAQQVGQAAEQYRKSKAMEWLGQEMPNWPERCPLKVKVTMAGAGGATSFAYDRGRVLGQNMHIEGSLDRLLASVLPHEVTHTVFAYYFRTPVPRWADEGGSVLSENDEERFSHDIRCRELLNGGRGIRLRVLFRMTEYPSDMMVLYAQGYSITDYLVRRGGDGHEGRAKLLQFLGYGMQGNTPDSWNQAANRVYGFDGIDALESSWLDALKSPPSRIAARGTGSAPGTPAGRSALEYASAGAPRTDVRSSAAPAVPVLEPPVRAARGAAPADEPAGRGSAANFPPARTVPVSTTTPAPAARPTAPETPPPAVLLPPEIPRR